MDKERREDMRASVGVVAEHDTSDGGLQRGEDTIARRTRVCGVETDDE